MIQHRASAAHETKLVFGLRRCPRYTGVMFIEPARPLEHVDMTQPWWSFDSIFLSAANNCRA